jgi:hypothetical protein
LSAGLSGEVVGILLPLSASEGGWLELPERTTTPSVHKGFQAAMERALVMGPLKGRLKEVC